MTTIKETFIKLAMYFLILAIFVSSVIAFGVRAISTTEWGRVVEVNNDIITVETNDGNLWDFYGENFEVNDNVLLRFVGDRVIDAD